MTKLNKEGVHKINDGPTTNNSPKLWLFSLGKRSFHVLIKSGILKWGYDVECPHNPMASKNVKERVLLSGR